MKLPCIIFLLLFHLSFPLRGQLLDSTIAVHSKFRCGPPIGPAIVIAEGLLAGLSYYASKPQAYGDMVVGGVFAASSVAMLVSVPFYWTDKSSQQDPYFKKERIWGAVMMVGMSYGFSRVATYNLLQAEGDGGNERFIRNLAEMNVAYIVPIGINAIALKTQRNKRKKNKIKTSFLFDGQRLGLLVRF